MVWGQIKSITGEDIRRDTLQPVQNKERKLMTDPIEVLEVHREHYRMIMQHDPDNHAMDEEHWQSKIMYCERAEDLQGINEDLTWLEALESIRRMKRNTAPGRGGIHVNILKQLVREECMGEIQQRNPGFIRPEYTLVDLSAEKLPKDPTTPMGKSLYRALKAVWIQEKIPAQWQEAHLVFLMKASGISVELGVDSVNRLLQRTNPDKQCRKDTARGSYRKAYKGVPPSKRTRRIQKKGRSHSAIPGTDRNSEKMPLRRKRYLWDIHRLQKSV